MWWVVWGEFVMIYVMVAIDAVWVCFELCLQGGRLF